VVAARSRALSVVSGGGSSSAEEHGDPAFRARARHGSDKGLANKRVALAEGDRAWIVKPSGRNRFRIAAEPFWSVVLRRGAAGELSQRIHHDQRRNLVGEQPDQVVEVSVSMARAWRWAS
jgi:hypothetical protein